MVNQTLTEPIRLKPEQRAQLLEMEESILLLRTEIAKAERAGIDMKDTKAKFEQMVKMRDGLLKEYS